MAAGCGSSSSAARPASAPATRPATTTTVDVAKPYDPSKPIDLGGTPGVTAVEQHRAERLVEATIVALRRYEYPSEAVAAGYRSIGDALTGDEHFVKWSYVDDGHILDPNRPESLVYEWQGGNEKYADVARVDGPEPVRTVRRARGHRRRTSPRRPDSTVRHRTRIDRKPMNTLLVVIIAVAVLSAVCGLSVRSEARALKSS
jgi:hypothetical protein